MKEIYLYIFTFVLLLLIIHYSFNENFLNYTPASYTNDFKYIDNRKKIKFCNKPRFTPFNGGNPMVNEMHVGNYYNNENIPTLAATDYRVSPSCCSYSRYSTSSGCICTDD